MAKVLPFSRKKKAVNSKVQQDTASLADDIFASVNQSLLNEANDHSLLQPQKVITPSTLEIVSIVKTLSAKSKYFGAVVDEHMRALITLGYIKRRGKTETKLKVVK